MRDMAGTTAGGGTYDVVGGAAAGIMDSLYGSLPHGGDSVQQRVGPTDPIAKKVGGRCWVDPDRHSSTPPVVLCCDQSLRRVCASFVPAIKDAGNTPDCTAADYYYSVLLLYAVQSAICDLVEKKRRSRKPKLMFEVATPALGNNIHKFIRASRSRMVLKSTLIPRGFQLSQPVIAYRLLCRDRTTVTRSTRSFLGKTLCS